MVINGHLTSELNTRPFHMLEDVMKKNPCYKCEDRTEICHSECERYIKWAEEREKFRNERFQERQVGWALSEHRDEAVRKALKAKR